MALAADKENSKGGRQNMAKLQNAVQLLQDSYSKTFNDRTEYQVSHGSTVTYYPKRGYDTILEDWKAHVPFVFSTILHIYSQTLLLIPTVLKKPVS